MFRISGKFFKRGRARKLASIATINGSAKAGASNASTQLPKVKHMTVSSVKERNAYRKSIELFPVLALVMAEARRFA